jgi:hypothetical protein
VAVGGLPYQLIQVLELRDQEVITQNVRAELRSATGCGILSGLVRQEVCLSNYLTNLSGEAVFLRQITLL